MIFYTTINEYKLCFKKFITRIFKRENHPIKKDYKIMFLFYRCVKAVFKSPPRSFVSAICINCSPCSHNEDMYEQKEELKSSKTR